jgi:hypothetical protein
MAIPYPDVWELTEGIGHIELIEEMSWKASEESWSRCTAVPGDRRPGYPGHPG